MTTTIKDVALQAGCSIKTVSRVINNEPFVSAQTREKVLQAIETLDYAPNFSARRLVTRKSFTIGILLHEAGFYQSAILSKMMDISYQHDYDILLQSYFPSHNRSRVKLAQLIHERRVDGLVVTPPCDVDPFLRQLLASADIPQAQITPLNRSRQTAFVSGDDYQGAFLMTEHLINLGHKRIAYLTGPRNHRMSIDRLYGYRAALDTYAIPQDRNLVLDSEFTFAGGYTAAKIMLFSDTPPSAIFAGSDDAALGALFAAQELGWKVPEQLSICGFNDLPQAQQTWPGLTTVSHPISDIVEKATFMLLEILSVRPVKDKQIILPSKLIIRKSTGRVFD